MGILAKASMQAILLMDFPFVFQILNLHFGKIHVVTYPSWPEARLNVDTYDSL